MAKKTYTASLFIDSQMFLDILSTLEKHIQEDQEKQAGLQLLFPDSHICHTSGTLLFDQIIRMLEIAFNDLETNWIQYYIWELDFGKEYKEGAVTFNERNVPMGTAYDLWYFLVNYNM